MIPALALNPGLIFCVWASLGAGDSGPAPKAAETSEARALAYLAREVPRWAAENKCYSCHNNGDAARALYTAWRLGYKVPPRSLADTSRWLSQPERWDHNGGQTGVSDKRLARIQFASALVEALEAGLVKDRKALQEAARKVVEDQATDGSWQVDAVGSVGSPATYGACLATYQARRILEKAEAAQFRTAIAKADQWLLKVQVKSVLDAAVVLLAMKRQGRAGSRCPPEHVFGASEQGSVGKGRLGAVCEISPGDIRYRPRDPGACAARWGQASSRDAAARPSLSRLNPGGRRQLAGNHASCRFRTLRTTPVHGWMGRTGTSCDEIVARATVRSKRAGCAKSILGGPSKNLANIPSSP